MDHKLSRCIESLSEIRLQLHDKLDPSILAELDAVIQSMQLLNLNGEDTADRQHAAILDGLKVLARIIESVAGIADLINRFWR